MTVRHRVAPAPPASVRPAATQHAVRACAAGLVRALRRANVDAALDEDGKPVPKGGLTHLHAALPGDAIAGRLGHGARVVQLWNAMPDAPASWVRRLALRGVPDILVPCACQAARLADAGAGAVHVVPGGVDLRDHAPASPEARADARARLGLAPDGVVALVRDAPGAAAGLAVARDAAERVPGLRLLMPAPGHDAATLHAAADFVVAPWRDGAGQPCHPPELLAALAAGLPVVASATGCLPEWLTHGRGALLVEPGDRMDLAEALASLAGDEAMRRRLGSEARAVAESGHDADAVAARVAAVYAKSDPGAAVARTDVPVRFAA